MSHIDTQQTVLTDSQTTTYFPITPNIAPKKHAFNQDAMAGLSLFDQILFEKFGQGPIVEPTYNRIHHAIEAQVMAQPNAIAAQHLGTEISYQDLNQQANRLAAVLTAHGVKAGDNVALFVRRSIPMLVGLLATLKVGAAYVPQDVRVAPEPQLRHIMNTTEAKVVLTLSEFKHLVPVTENQICIVIDDLMQSPFAENDNPIAPFIPNNEISTHDRCFILFTSGTTGNPNGVQVTHNNVCNILLTEPGNVGMRPGLKVGQILSISFDMAAWEILGSLSHGATLVIRGREFEPVIENVDIVIATPSILGRFDPARCHNVKVVAVAGEPCPKPLADAWSEFATFYNSCGPTETTIVNTAQEYDRTTGHLTIGKPTPNNTVYVLDKEMKPCAIGEIGEMWAGGDCVSAGYLNNPELTADRYAPDPFLGNGRKMFRTRDLGRWTQRGELEHFGRTDDQVKIRGFRVELDSVSGAIESEESCTQAVTLKYDSRDLVAFVRPATADLFSAEKAITDKLPYYCVPAMIIPLDEFPMTSRGKVDKRSLMQIAKERLSAA